MDAKTFDIRRGRGGNYYLKVGVPIHAVYAGADYPTNLLPSDLLYLGPGQSLLKRSKLTVHRGESGDDANKIWIYLNSRTAIVVSRKNLREAIRRAYSKPAIS